MRLRLAGFSGMLVITMAMSTLAFFAIAVVAVELEEELGISKLEIGLLGAINTGVGGLVAPAAGRLTDRWGGRRAMGAVLATSGASAVLIALSQSYLTLMIAMGLAGIPQGGGNPATNKAIFLGADEAERGVLTGIKQSGVQLAVFTSGFAMPPIAAAWGWRAGLWMTAAISFTALLGVMLVPERRSDERPGARDERRNAASGEAGARSRRALAHGEGSTDPSPGAKRETGTDPSPGAKPEAKATLPPFVYQVAIFGFLLGTVGGGLGRFLPLFAEEAAGFSTADAGRVFGLQGIVAIPTRIASGVLLDRGVSARAMLVTMGVGGAGAVVLILLATGGPGAFLWIGTVLAGLTLGSWNTAANLSMIREKENAGRASGILMIGFLLGLTVGGPLVGWSIDTFDGYTPAWLASAVAALIGSAVVARRPAEPARYP